MARAAHPSLIPSLRFSAPSEELTPRFPALLATHNAHYSATNPLATSLRSDDSSASAAATGSLCATPMRKMMPSSPGGARGGADGEGRTPPGLASPRPLPPLDLSPATAAADSASTSSPAVTTPRLPEPGSPELSARGALSASPPSPATKRHSYTRAAGVPHRLAGGAVPHTYSFAVPESACEEAAPNVPILAGGPTLDQILASNNAEESRMTFAEEDGDAETRPMAAATDLRQDFSIRDATTALEQEARRRLPPPPPRGPVRFTVPGALTGTVACV